MPLNGGHVPEWLAQRMRKLTRLALKLAVRGYGIKGLLERLSDPLVPVLRASSQNIPKKGFSFGT